MRLLLIGVIEETGGHGLGMNAGGHVVMTFIAQHTDNFRRQDFIEYADHGFPVGTLAAGDRALLHVLTGAPAELLYV
jgi:hypothetical protein